MNVSLLVETAAVKAARILKYAVANAMIIFAICQASMACDEARAIVAGFQMSDNHGSAFKLFTLLEDRFTLKKLQTLQKLLVELNQMICLVMETPTKLLDRFDKLVLGIKAIDATQLPTELQLITILKNAIAEKFKLLNAMFFYLRQILPLFNCEKSSSTGSLSLRWEAALRELDLRDMRSTSLALGTAIRGRNLL